MSAPDSQESLNLTGGGEGFGRVTGHRTGRGKAPPVDSFTEEESDVRFDDWLYTFARACSHLEQLDRGGTIAADSTTPPWLGSSGMGPVG